MYAPIRPSIVPPRALGLAAPLFAGLRRIDPLPPAQRVYEALVSDYGTGFPNLGKAVLLALANPPQDAPDQPLPILDRGFLSRTGVLPESGRLQILSLLHQDGVLQWDPPPDEARPSRSRRKPPSALRH